MTLFIDDDDDDCNDEIVVFLLSFAFVSVVLVVAA